jgi:hypothetical protein
MTVKELIAELQELPQDAKKFIIGIVSLTLMKYMLKV